MNIANAANALNLRWHRRHPAARRLPPALVMTDAARLPDPLVVLDRLPAGWAVLFRHYEVGPQRRGELARRLAAACRGRRLKLIVAGDPRLAARIGADGVHLPERMTRDGGDGWRLFRKPGWIVTASCHSRTALLRAGRAGVDAAVVAPVFSTASHPGTPALGAIRFAALVRAGVPPVYALGGIDAAAVRRLGYSGAVGIAGIGFAAGLLATRGQNRD